MNKDILMIIQSCDTLHEVEMELSRPFGFLRFKDKKEFKLLKKAINDKIKSLMDDMWTVGYLYDLQNALKAYKSKLESYMRDIYISEDNSNPLGQQIFDTMYFNDINRNNKILLDVVGTNITFTIFDNTTGNSFSVSSSDFVQESQKKIESVCKERLVEMLENYLNSVGGERTV